MLNILNLHSGAETGQGKVRAKMIRGAGLNFQRGMWAEAWIQSINARRFVALAVLGETALRTSADWFEFSESFVAGLALGLVSTLLWAYLAYAVHAQILLPDDRDSTMANTRVFGFALRSFGIVIVVGIVFALGAFVLARMVGVWPGIAGLLAAIALGFPLFVWLATLLPAYVAGRARGVSAAIERGKAHFGWIAGRLLIGPFLLLILFGTLYSILSIPVDSIGPFWNEERVFLPINFFGFLSFNIVQAFATALTAVILSRAFLREEGMPDPAAA